MVTDTTTGLADADASRTDPRDDTAAELVRTARTTGLLYLLMVLGAVGFLIIRPALFEPGDPAGTLGNLLDHDQLARVGIAAELFLVIAQALTALWFYRLFRTVDSFLAGAIAVFGLVNAIAVLASAAFLATALDVAQEPLGRADEVPHLMYLVSENLWGVGGVFFGLWLLPMGACVLRSGWLPRALGWVLLAGGVGYVVSAFLGYLLPDSGAVTGALVVPATVGEFWAIGYLLVKGVDLSTPRES